MRASIRGGTPSAPGLPVDSRRAEILLQDLQLTGPAPWWCVFEHPGKPIPKGRHRSGISKDGKPFHYTPGNTREAERELGKRWTYELRRRGLRLPLLEPLALVVAFYMPSLHRVDRDNLEKLVMDAATRAGVWKDDSQVVAGAQWVVLDRENPRTLIALAQHDSSFGWTRETRSQAAQRRQLGLATDERPF